MKAFLDMENVIGVVGASRDKSKWGYKVWRHLKDQGYTVYPINPKAEEIDGERVYEAIAKVPEKLSMVVTVVPPSVTEQVVKECAKRGVKRVWMQPGSESEEAVEFCEESGIEVVQNACMVRDGLGEEFS